ncbi:CAP domain-containing protein [Lactiplantibacillus paraxiangfangensis]|uniref:CAP domain-containing protein n=1 Tax=Lactiplantibacillus paraxiangfangensis TaxID=3076224 RepID=UPI0030C76DDD
MKKSTKFTSAALVAVTVLGGSVLAQPTNATASSAYKRNKITKVKAENYYSMGSKGWTYVFKGNAKHLVLKHNHKLANYKKTTWVSTAKTTLTRHGQKYLYYYVTNTKNNAKGWVWNVHLQAGKNYQSSKVTNFKGTYQRKKSGKLYKITGSKKYIKLSHGSKLANNVKYTASKKRTIYKKRKAYKYYYVTNKTTKQKGWVWSSYLTKYGKSGTANTASNDANEVYNAKVVVSDAIKVLNRDRAKRGLNPVVSDDTLQKIAAARGPQMNVEFNHSYKGTNASSVLAKEYGIYDSYYATEDLIAVSSSHATNLDTATDLIEGFQGDAHWGDLMNPSFTKVGIALTEITDEPGGYYVAVEFGF